VCTELRRAGHEAYSCDVLPCSGGHPEWHMQRDCVDVLDAGWDMIIAFPPCTHLCASGAMYWKQKRTDGRQQAAIDFVGRIASSDCPRIAIENPVGVLSAVWRKPDQIIQPWQFGDPFTKKTCLWLKGLLPLRATDVVEPTHMWCNSSSRTGPRKDGSRPKSSLKRANPWISGSTAALRHSKTFPGIAAAMASQWSARNDGGVPSH
jgi:hypothetical protein